MTEGILLVILAGIIWAAVGVIMSYVASSGRAIPSFYATAGLLAAVFASAFVVRWPAVTDGEVTRLGEMALWVGISGVANGLGKALVVMTMRRGHRGMILAIANASMVVPFMAAAVLWGEEYTETVWVGVACMLAAVVLLARHDRAAPQTTRIRSWLLPTLLALAIMGIGRTAVIVPSRWAGWDDAARLRPVVALAAAGLVHVAIMLVRRIPFDRRLLPHAALWAALAVVAYSIFFRAVDILGKLGLSGIVFPTAVGVCVMAFSLYSHVRLREPYTPRALTGLGLALLGLALIAV